jgi:hypothetical protein
MNIPVQCDHSERARCPGEADLLPTPEQGKRKGAIGCAPITPFLLS